MIIFTKDILIRKFKEIKNRGWIENKRHNNHGGIGNTLEDLLGIEENNLPIPNAAEWELKAQKIGTSSLTTLFHSEPSPRALKFVPSILLPIYGWKHKEADQKYQINEMSFRQTINGNNFTNRGFGIQIDRKSRKILISFDFKKVDSSHNTWLKIVESNIGLKELNPQPYWGFDDLMHKAGTKLLNTFYVQAEVKKDKETKKESYYYCKVLMLQKFNFDGFLNAMEEGNILIDFDART
ncbi:MAG: MvaI/BcnI family restriction endonuclease, partial [Candidatus Cloacimonadales bacterium]|nr:MvaI/BcnI family restriction endonuclease [Candidatus Cloacimonadales bacterium]